MTKEEFLKSNYFKVLLPMLVLVGLIAIWQSGYSFGQWLYKAIH